jgi:hypothetical protein
MRAARRQVVAPGVPPLFEAAARRVLPLGLGGQTLAGPGCVGERVVPGDVDDRVAPRPSMVLGGPSGHRQLAPGTLAPPGGVGDAARRGTSSAGRASNDLPAGVYTARVVSGNVALGPAVKAVGDEVELDFDSARADIEAGATPIARNFLVNGRVRDEILDEQGEVVASETVRCRVRR